MSDTVDKQYLREQEAKTRAAAFSGLPEEMVTEDMTGAVGNIERGLAKKIWSPDRPAPVGMGEEVISKPKPEDEPGKTLAGAAGVQRLEFDEQETGMLDLIKQAGTGVVTGTKGLAAGVGGTIEAAGGFVSMLDEAIGVPEYGAGEAIEKLGGQTREYWQDQIESSMLNDPYLWEGDFYNNPSWQRAAGLMGAAAPSLLAAMTTAQATGSTGAAAVVLGMLEGSPMYAEARDAGKGRGMALAAAGTATAAIAFLEKVGLDGITKSGRGWIGRFLGGGLAEGVTESAQQAVQNAIAHFGYDETRSLIEGLGDSFVAGFGSGGPMSVVSGAGGAEPGARAEGADVQAVIKDAVKKKIIDRKAAKIASRLAELDPTIDDNTVLEIANLRVVADEEILAAQGIVPKKGLIYTITGKHQPEVVDGVLKSTISLFKGVKADTFVEEWYHRYLDNIKVNNPSAYTELETLYDTAEDGRSMQEWFGHQGRDWFMAERPDSPVAAILEKAKQGILKLVGAVKDSPGANIDPLLLEHFQRAGGAKAAPAAEGVAAVEPEFYHGTTSERAASILEAGEISGSVAPEQKVYAYSEYGYGVTYAARKGQDWIDADGDGRRLPYEAFVGVEMAPDVVVTEVRSETDFDRIAKEAGYESWQALRFDLIYDFNTESQETIDAKPRLKAAQEASIAARDALVSAGHRVLDVQGVAGTADQVVALDPTALIPTKEVERPSYQVAGMDTGVGGWLSDVMGLDTATDITKAITAMYTEPEKMITVGGEKMEAGDLRQRYTQAVVSGSYQVVPEKINEVHYVRTSWGSNLEVIKNPTPSDYGQIKREMREEFPNMPAGTPTVRHTIDGNGNRYIWRADRGMHENIEPLIAEQLNAGEVNQNLPETISYQVKPMRIKRAEGTATVQDTLAALEENYDDWVAGVLDQIDVAGKAEATETGGVLNLKHLDVSEETKALMASSGFGIRELELMLAVSRDKRKMTPEEVMQSALKDPMTLEDVLTLPENTKINRELIFWVRFHQARAYNHLNSVAQAAQNPIEDVDVKESLKDELFKSFVVAIQSSNIANLVRAEAGRSLQYYGTDVSGREVAMDNLFNLFNQTLETGRNVGFDELVDMVNTLDSPAQLDALIAPAVNPGWGDMFHEYWLFALLSGPKTQMVNLVSNTGFLGMNVMERQIAGLNPQQNVRVTEAAHMTWAMVTGLGEALAAASKAFVTLESKGTKAGDLMATDPGLQEDSRREPKISAKNIGGKLGAKDFADTTLGKGVDFLANWVIRLPFRGLSGGDAFFRSLAHRMEFRALALRQAYQNHKADIKAGVEAPIGVQGYFDAFMGIGTGPQPLTVLRAREGLMRQAEDFADIVTFQKELGTLGKGFSRFANAHLAMRFVLPFVRTPSNILRETIKRTPLETGALLDPNSALSRAMAEGGAERDLAMAKIALGGMVAGVTASLVQGGYISGGPPEDRKRKQALERMGHKWYSVNLSALRRGDPKPLRGDLLIPYDRIDPMGALIGTIADTMYIMGTTDPDDPFINEELPAAVVLALTTNMTNKTYLRGVADFSAAALDPYGWKAENYFKRLGTSFIPNALTQPGQATDPYRRRMDTMMDRAKVKSGYFRSETPRRQDRWGRFVKDNPWGFWGMFFPGYMGEAKPNPVDEELLRIQELGGDVAGLGTKQFDTLGSGPNAVELTPELREEYLGEAGSNAYDLIEAVVKKSPKRLKDVLDGMIKSAEKGTVFVGATSPLDIESAKSLVDIYNETKNAAETPEGQMFAGEQLAKIVSNLLSFSTKLAAFNLAKNNEDVWKARNAPGLAKLHALAMDEGLREAFGVDLSTVQEGIRGLEGAFEELTQ